MGNLRRGRRGAPPPDGGVGVGGRAPGADPPWEDGQSDAPGNATPYDHSRVPAHASPLSGRKARSCGLVLAAASLALFLNWKRERRKKHAKGLI